MIHNAEENHLTLNEDLCRILLYKTIYTHLNGTDFRLKYHYVLSFALLCLSLITLLLHWTSFIIVSAVLLISEITC